MTQALLLALALPFASAPSAQNYITTPPLPSQVGLDGPLDFCGEDFSIRLERGERVRWRPSTYSVGKRYVVESGDSSADVFRQQEGGVVPPADGATAVADLPLSPVARRAAFEMPSGTVTDGKGNVRQITTFGIRYFLHGRAETATPLYVLGFHGDRNGSFLFLDRIDPRPLAERNCVPSRTDPALAGRIVQIPGGY